MRIAMFTNTYLPQIGGVAKSVHRFSSIMRQRGHDVLIVAPTYDKTCEDEEHIHRIEALQHFNGSDFSVALPLGFDMATRLDDFSPDVIHSHHPFLLGNSALRYAAPRKLPLVFTHHTMYEFYTHYVPVELEALKEYVIRLSTGYANFCDAVIAPSESTAEIIRNRGVKRPIHVGPTGVDINDYEDGNGKAGRQQWGIPEDAFVIGTVGRLAPEKNLAFLTEAVAATMTRRENVWFLVVGGGPSRQAMARIVSHAGISERVKFAGVLRGKPLRNAYHAMNIFAFASKTETQGMVLVEAMATGCPVVALDAPGAREVVTSGVNGELLQKEDADEFAAALSEIGEKNTQAYVEMRQHARESAEPFSTDACVDRVMDVYEDVRSAAAQRKDIEHREWKKLLALTKREWNIWSNRIKSFGEAILAQEIDQLDDLI